MPKPPGKDGWLPEWQEPEKGKKTECWKIFLDFHNFRDLRAYKSVVEENRAEWV